MPRFDYIHFVKDTFWRGFNYNNNTTQSTNFFDNLAQYEIDLTEMKEAGFNSVRHYIDSKMDKSKIYKALDIAERIGIKVFALNWISYNRDYSLATGKANRKQEIDDFTGMIRNLKDHPAIVAYGFGSESNVHLGVTPEYDYYFMLEEGFKAGKDIDPTRFYYTAQTDSAEQCKRQQDVLQNIDVWGVNLYRSTRPNEASWRQVVQKYMGLDRPFLVTEFGISKWNSNVFDTDNQSKALVTAMRTLESLPCVVGVHIFKFDEGWGVKPDKELSWGIAETQPSTPGSRAKYPAWEAIKKYSIDNPIQGNQ